MKPSPYNRGVVSAPHRPADTVARRLGALAGPVVAGVALLAALIATDAAGVPLRDPGHVSLGRLGLAAALTLLLVGLDIWLRAARRSGRRLPSRETLRTVRRERWTRARGIAVTTALVSFFVTYLAYRNLKSVVPLLRPDELSDGRLGDLDRGLFAGHDPADLLHSLVGTGLTAQLLSGAYMLFFVFIPVSLAAALAFSEELRRGLFFVTAMAINWPLGAASYYLAPSLGPIYAEPATFAHLPDTHVADLQARLLAERTAFLHDPAVGGAQSIGAFASLHVSITFTAALAAQLLGVRRAVRLAAWTLFGLTALATVYFGWHYVLDDLGGMLIAVAALAMARALAGSELLAGRSVPAPSPTLA
jgi:hypothetical protein